ncbi:hypothetical protein GEV33_001325 [Tenebrio molitor]|uniref:Uncharacterized protein n=1 Tax=Tenebrio molitor TaxID=7067 RepID=A0A8J6LQB4_TENMO|nr:hypothetical protein GEV33_001325 [Tenebrio molitor]
MEIYWRDNFICPTEKEYLDVICPKTSSAILFGVKVMQLFSNYTENLDTLVILLGQICQIQNDFSSLQLNKQVKVKTFCEDIGEGKFSFPIIHAIQSHPDDNEIMEENRQFRQNIATANATYSVADALGACVYGTYIEMENMAKIWPFEDFNKTKLIVKPEVEFYRGRGMEIDWMNNAECPTEEEYFKAAVRKTGSTIEFMIQMMQLFSTNQADFTHLAQILGKFFHVYDDYINLKSMDGQTKPTVQTPKMSKTEEEILFIPYTHIKEAPKINVISMAKLMQAYNFWLKIPKDKFQIIQKISGLTDTGCFMLDELQSLCEPRKAIGMHQAVDSIPSTINAANYAGCNALEKCLELDHSKAGSIYIEQMMQFYRGQGSEIYCRDNYVCPTEEEYRKMCIRSTFCNCCL